MKPFLVEYTKANIFRVNFTGGGGSVRFMPGVNEITQDQWDSIKDHPLLPLRFQNGDLKWVALRGPDDMPKADRPAAREAVKGQEVADNPLEGLSVKAAVKLVEKTVDAPTLNKWAESDLPKAVSKAVKDQLKKIAPEKPKKSEEDADSGDGE